MKYLAFISLIFLFFCTPGQLFAQTDSTRTDSLGKTDSAALIKQDLLKSRLLQQAQQQINHAADSLRNMLAPQKGKRIVAGVQHLLATNPNYQFAKTPVSLVVERRKTVSREGIFYFILALILYIALMRLFFSKYMSTMFTLFFRATLRQQQLREQMLQSPLPALLMNIYFVIVTAAYFAFMSSYTDFHLGSTWWSNFLYAALLVSGIYIGKFIVLNICGWIFGIRQVTDTYIFIVFLTNKMIGILLLPFVILIAFPNAEFLPSVIILSYIMLGAMLLYRFVISFRPVRAEIKLNRLHFFLYLCAFEIAPLLLIYRVLLAYT